MASESRTPSDWRVSQDDPAHVDGRYKVLSLLGRGGMASVYRVRDELRGTELALKRLSVADDDSPVVELFEREYHTLTELAHPRVVRAYDYGRDGAHPYYTMELLDGGDVQALAPMPWQQVCVIAYELCSALALLHSRRLVHRDLTPRNIRRTADGTAKLIDFGLLSPFGPSTLQAGTVPYVPPELVHGVSLDGRSDLYSLGATLYYALTGHVAFPAHRFWQLRDLWRTQPPSPSELAPGVPEPLSSLVMALLRVSVSARPKCAAEVMDRLRPLLEKAPDEELGVADAYLSAPQLVGREPLVVRIRKQLVRSARGRGGGLVVAGASGTGRSRMLDSFVLEAKLIGAAVARADASDSASGPLSMARVLVEQIHSADPSASFEAARALPEAWSVLFGDEFDRDDGAPPAGGAGAARGLHVAQEPPRLLDVSRPGNSRAKVQGALRGWIRAIARQRLVAIAVDDLELADQPSAALVASLALDADACRLALAVTVQPHANAGADPALTTLADNARRLELAPLSAEEVTALLVGVFGNVPNLQGLSTRLHGLCGGRPRDCMALSQHLVDKGVISYRDGRWRLPSQLDASVLPADMEAALSAQIDGLSDCAMAVGQALALSVLRRLSRSVLARLPGLSTLEVDRAVGELRGAQLLVGAPAGYTLSHQPARSLLLRRADAAAVAQLHGRLADVCEELGEPTIVVAHHRLQSDVPGTGLDFLLSHCATMDDRSHLVLGGVGRVGDAVTAETLSMALDQAEALQRPAGDCLRLRMMLAAIAAHGQDPRHYHRVAPALLAQLKDQTGFDDWLRNSAEPDQKTRALQALARATERYESRDAGERALTPADAIKELVVYVVCSIPVSTRTLDVEVARGLPALLEPFAPLSPLVDAMLRNARASLANCMGMAELAREQFLELASQMDAIEPKDFAIADRIRAGISQKIATLEATLGIQQSSSQQWLETTDPSQQIGVQYVKKVGALHRGAWEEAELLRQKAELVALQGTSGAMYSTLGEELEAHANARELSGLRAVRNRIHEMASRYPGWVQPALVADAYCHLLCGELDRALSVVEQVRADDAGAAIESRWVMLASVVEVEALVESGQAAQALQRGLGPLARCQQQQRRHLARALSLGVAAAETALGRCDAARQRIESVIAKQRALGVRGLLLGRSYELMAKVAIASGDREAFERAAEVVKREYDAGSSAVLGALYERLVDQARRAGLSAEADEAASAGGGHQLSEVRMRVYSTLSGCDGPEPRARAALELLCHDDVPREGYLFLLTKDGLTFAASSDASPPPPDLDGLLHFARAWLELETDDDECAMTAAMLDDLERTDKRETPYRDSRGRHLFPMSLFARDLGRSRIVGVALLSDNGGERSAISTLASVLALHLVKTGDCQAIQAP